MENHLTLEIFRQIFHQIDTILGVSRLSSFSFSFPRNKDEDEKVYIGVKIVKLYVRLTKRTYFNRLWFKTETQYIPKIWERKKKN